MKNNNTVRIISIFSFILIGIICFNSIKNNRNENVLERKESLTVLDHKNSNPNNLIVSQEKISVSKKISYKDIHEPTKNTRHGVGLPKDTASYFARLRRKKNKSKKTNRLTGIQEYQKWQKEIRTRFNENKPSYNRGYQHSEYKKALNFLANKPVRFNQLSAISNITWTERGPVNVPGRQRDISIHPNDPNTLLVGSVGGGIWKTTDLGKTWQTITDYKISNLATSYVQYAPSNPDVIYIGTGEPYGNFGSIGGNGLYKSIDGGTTWSHIETTLTFGDIGRLVINPNDEDNVIAATRTGIYITTDGGGSWTKTHPSGNVQDLRVDPNDFNIQYASVQSASILKSTDAGQTWISIHNFAGVSRIELDVAPSNSDYVILSAYGGTPNTQFLLSKDGGDSGFINLTFDPTNSTGTDFDLLTGQGWYDNTVNFHPFKENIFYVGGVNTFKVTINADEGKFSYTALSDAYSDFNSINSYVHPDQHNIFPVVTDASAQEFRLMLGTDGGFYITNPSTDPGVTQGDFIGPVMQLNTTQFYGADKKNGSDDYIAGAQDNGTWFSTGGNSDKTKEYIFAIGGDGYEAIWNYEDGNMMIGGFQGSSTTNNLRRSTDGGQSWSSATTGLTGSAPFYNKIANVKNDPYMLYTVRGTGVGRSEDFGESWTMTALTNFSGSNSAADVVPSIANPNIVWAGSSMDASSGVSYSTDRGLIFTEAQGSDGAGGTISGIETHPTEPNTAYVLFSQSNSAKIMETKDLGQTWTDITGISTGIDTGFPNVAVHSLLVMPWDTDIIWAGTEIGLFETTDHGASWYFVNEIPSMPIYEMKIVNDQVVMAVYGRGIWTATIAELANYEYPVFPKNPKVLGHHTNVEDNKNIIEFKLENDIDSAHVIIDGEYLETITEANAIFKSDLIEYTIKGEISEGIHNLQLKSFLNSIQNISSDFEILVNKYTSAISDFEYNTIAESNLLMRKFVISQPTELTSSVLNIEDHPYLANKTYEAYLKSKVKMASEEDKLVISQIVLTEIGYDFARIEGSKDGKEWVELLKLDASGFSSWEAALEDNSLINDDLFELSEVDLATHFVVDDEIAIRFILETDQVEHTWGWAINSISKTNVSVNDYELPTNVKVKTLSETCSGSNNGSVEITAIADVTYSATLSKAGAVVGQTTFQNSQVATFDSLEPGEYTVCVSVGSAFEQCYTVNVEEAQTTSAAMRFDTSARTIQIEVSSGTAPYSVFVNGVRTKVSDSKSIQVDAYNVNNIRVTSEYDCEGMVEFKSEDIELLRPLVVYPNPVQEDMVVEIPQKIQGLNANFKVYDISGKEVKTISNSSLPALFKTNLSDLQAGYYLIVLRAEGVKPVTFKIVKK